MVYIHGVTISKHDGVLCSISYHLARLERDLDTMKGAHGETADQTFFSDIRAKLVEYNELAQNEVTHLGEYATAKIYGEGEYLGATLAALIRPSHGESTVLTVLDERNMPLYEAGQLIDRFSLYYIDRYTSRTTHDKQAVAD